MPGMGGRELRRRLAAAAGSSLPVIFITAHAGYREARTQALAAGAVVFLGKPFDEESLLGAVQTALRA